MDMSAINRNRWTPAFAAGKQHPHDTHSSVLLRKRNPGHRAHYCFLRVSSRSGTRCVPFPKICTLKGWSCTIRSGSLQSLILGIMSWGGVNAGAPLAGGMYRSLTDPIEAWHFNMRCPPEESGRKSLDLSFTADGIFNAVLFWYTLELTPNITISSAPALSTGSSGV